MAIKNLFKRTFLSVIVITLSFIFIYAGIGVNAETSVGNTVKTNTTITNISDLSNLIDSQIESYFDNDVVTKLPDTVEEDDEISIIITLDKEGLFDHFENSNSKLTFSEYLDTKKASDYLESINEEIKNKQEEIKNSNIDVTFGETYDTLLCGFEVTTKASNFTKLQNLCYTETLIVGEVYEEQETEVVTNYVNVYDTGIFDSSMIDYQGDGVVVAVLDTGLDYTHTAFSVSNFTTTNAAFDLDYVQSKINDTQAKTFTSGLTGEDVYINKKVPYAYDYADKDADVFPINSEHGTHVAGIIAGKDDTITGVAPNAQLAIFKVFSDHQDGAKTSWLIAALEDCVVLGVDVINMSLGSACGFARESDKENVNKIYDKVKEAGIELIASAANQYNSTMGSTKNGNNGLTSNPDSGTVGSPSTYSAALSVASVEGLKTSYIKLGETIIYFKEASTTNADIQKDFTDDILSTIGEDVDSHEFEYVVIPGIGRSSDYPDEDSFYEGKIVLVKRGTTTFEDKVRVALKEKGAAGIIIYNNVSGSISMQVGANIGAVCSVTQDEGELLAASVDPETGIGKITVSREQLAGPFMSDFSSWGPTSDLQIKPEITAHGGQILSAVPGQGYERLSGTSMAAPNLTGAAALIIQYVKYSGIFGDNLTSLEVTNIVNQLMMSTADIIYDKNGLPSAVRKQGAGLVSIDKACEAESYLTTYDSDNEIMDKTKIELGDDKGETGVYTFKFDINNISTKAQTYDLGSIVITEGVSTTYTSHGELTVTQTAYELSGATIKIKTITNGVENGNEITVEAGKTCTVEATITLSDTDKKYLKDNFENGMYVEGFVTLTAKNNTKISLNIPFLAFFGDWTKAPIFDEEYYDTNKDELNKGLDDEDKLMPDAYATRVIGGLYSDYISTLGTYYFKQDPNQTSIAASKDHIAISNQSDGSGNSTLSSIRSVSAGLLRNCRLIDIEIVEDSTGEVIYTASETNQHKSYSSGSTIYASSIDIEYSILEHNLKNNTSYTCTLTAYIDYGENSEQKNTRNTFSFPFYVDFEAPIVTGSTYRTEYDKTTKKTSFYVDLSIYDNHYAMGAQIGQITKAPEDSEYTFQLSTFGKYITPVYSSYNSTSVVTIELTDYINLIKNSAGITYDENGNATIVENNNCFIVMVYDYAMNSATYEIELPDEILHLEFNQENLNLSPNETCDLASIIDIYPTSSWLQILDFTSSDSEVVDIVNNTIIAKKSGSATITASGKDAYGNEVTTSIDVKVLAEGDEGYVGGYSIPEINKFNLDGYKTLKAYYLVNSSDRDIGVTDSENDFGDTVSLEMYPSEQVELLYTLDSYFPEKTSIKFKASNTKIATVDENGVITAQAKGNTTIMVNVYFDDKATLYSARVSIEVKDPFEITSIYLYSYRGLGGTVEIPSNRGITTIYNYAFSGYEYVEKDLENGDVIDEEDPYYIKQQYLGDDTITKIIIPEGVTTINSYAFANLTALEEVVFPSTLTRIGVGAFYNCTSLKTVNLENVKFINEKAFYNCPLESLDFTSTISIGDYAFENCQLSHVELPTCAQSLAAGAFYNNTYLTSVTLNASKIKIGSNCFAKCDKLSTISINASVISSHAFEGCSELTDVTLGADVSVIGEYAFSGTNVSSFKLSSRNKYLTLEENGALILKGDELVQAAPNYVGKDNTITTTATHIGTGAFSGNKKLFYFVGENVTTIDAYAFSECTNLKSIDVPNIETIGDYAFCSTGLEDIGDISKVKEIGNYAFAQTDLESISLPKYLSIGDYAFAYCVYLKDITIQDNTVVGKYAFYNPVYSYTYENANNFEHYSPYTYEVKDSEGNVVKTNSYYRYNYTDGVISQLKTITIGNAVTINEGAFYGNGKVTKVSLGNQVEIGDYAFYSCASLVDINLKNVTSIGKYAFSGYRTLDYCLENNVWRYAYVNEYDDGVFVNTSYMYSCFAPQITSIDLTTVESIGEGAFMGCEALVDVIYSEKVTSIANGCFANTKVLEEIYLPENITSLEDYAFYSSGIKTINLDNIDSIGEYAFLNTYLESITLKDNVTIGNYAFYYTRSLKEVNNANNIKSIGDYAFTLTGIESIDLSNVETIGDFAFSQASLTKVVLGEKLNSLGENPFYGCDIETFGKVTYKEFGEYQDKQVEETYQLNDKIYIIDGVLYQAIPTGLELVSYPKLKADKEFTINKNTTRISATAFAYSNVEKVTLSIKLKAIGDKAFYGCEALHVVVFMSLDAPILEETYNTSYLSYLNLPISSKLGEYEGLGISSYYMWNLTSNYTNFYFGANFVDYIGHNNKNLVMCKPINGNNYDSFIFSQYFGTIVDGNYAPNEDTIKAIEAIDLIPTNVTLASEELITTARALYDVISTADQQALVTNLETLSQAESTLEYLKSRDAKDDDEPVEPTPVTPEKVTFKEWFNKNQFVIALVLGLIISAGACVLVYEFIIKKRGNKNEETK